MPRLTRHMTAWRAVALRSWWARRDVLDIGWRWRVPISANTCHLNVPFLSPSFFQAYCSAVLSNHSIALLLLSCQSCYVRDSSAKRVGCYLHYKLGRIRWSFRSSLILFQTVLPCNCEQIRPTANIISLLIPRLKTSLINYSLSQIGIGLQSFYNSFRRNTIVHFAVSVSGPENRSALIQVRSSALILNDTL